MKSIAKLVNTSNQTLKSSQNILFASNIINSQSIVYNADGTIQLKAPGIYQILANFDFVPVGTTAQVVMYEGNSPSIGAEASAETTAGDLVNLGFSTVVSVKPSFPGSYATIYFNVVNEGTVSNANIIIEKI